MLNGIGKNLGLSLPFFLSVLLWPDDDSFRTIYTIDAVDSLIKSAHLQNILGTNVEKVLLDGRVGNNARHDYPSLLIPIALAEDTLQHIVGSLHDRGS